MHRILLNGLTVADAGDLLAPAVSHDAPEDADVHRPSPVDPSSTGTDGDVTAEHPSLPPYASHTIHRMSATDVKAPAHENRQLDVMPGPRLSQHSFTDEFKRELGSDELHQLYTAACNMGSPVVPV